MTWAQTMISVGTKMQSARMVLNAWRMIVNVDAKFRRKFLAK